MQYCFVERNEKMKKSRLVAAIVMSLMLIATLIPVTAFGATYKPPMKCPKCYKKYKITYTMGDRRVYSTSKVSSYKMWVPVLKEPLYNGGSTTCSPSVSKSEGTEVEYIASGSFTWGNFSLGGKYTKKLTKQLGVSVPVKLKPKYYGQVYIATNLDKFKSTCKHSLKCFKCGYVYKKNYLVETKYLSAPLKSQAVEFKTKTSKKLSDVKYKEYVYNYCSGICTGGGGGGR